MWTLRNALKFILIDKIEALEPGRRIVTRKNLSLAEEYLGDHFPTFPVLPGVLMLEQMTQSAAWLVRIAQDFRHSIIELQSARNVRYGYFLKPGNCMRCEIDVVEISDGSAKFKGKGFVDDRQAVSATLELRCESLADRGAYGQKLDEQVTDQLRRHFSLIGGPEALEAAGQQNS